MSGMFDKYLEKAQEVAQNAAQRLPPQINQALGGLTGSTGPTPSSGAPNAQQQPGNSGTSGRNVSAANMLKQYGLGTFSNQLNLLKAQYNKGNDRQVQLAITAQKSVVLDYEATGRDAQIYSKELYLWGQEQTEDLKDVVDRLAYFNYVHGSLNTDLSSKLDTARGPWKNTRATEVAVGTLKAQNQPIDKVSEELEVGKRNAIKQGESARWKAIREYAEKLILVSQASEAIINETLPDHALAPGEQYSGKQRSAEIRTILQQSLDNWTPNPTLDATSPFNKNAPVQSTPDPRSFGETHQSELARTPSFLERQRADQEVLLAHQSQQATPTSPPASDYGTGINPAALNNAPAPVPTSPFAQSRTSNTSPNFGVGSPERTSFDGATNTSNDIAASHPTVAETGVPIAASGGPGPSSGSLRSNVVPPAGASWGAGYPGDASRNAGKPGYETAEDEKKRLEKEERERILHGGASRQQPPSDGPPAYDA